MGRSPHQVVKEAKKVTVEFGVAGAPGDVTINVTKAEANRLIRAHSLGVGNAMHDVGTVDAIAGDAVLTFHT